MSDVLIVLTSTVFRWIITRYADSQSCCQLFLIRHSTEEEEYCVVGSRALSRSLEDEYRLDEMPAMLCGFLALFASFFVLFNKVLIMLSASVEDDVILLLCCISFGFHCCFVFHVVVWPLELLINM